MEPPPSAEVAEAQETGADGGGPGGEKQEGPRLRERPRRWSESLQQTWGGSPTDGAGRGEGGKAHAAESRHRSVRMPPSADHDASTCDSVLESWVHREL